MAVKNRSVECECGEVFQENEKGELIGNLIYSPWRCKQSKVRQTKTAQQCDILLCSFERAVGCGKCKQEIFRDRRQYEVTPPIGKESTPVTSYSSKDYIFTNKEPFIENSAEGVKVNE